MYSQRNDLKLHLFIHLFIYLCIYLFIYLIYIYLFIYFLTSLILFFANKDNFQANLFACRLWYKVPLFSCFVLIKSLDHLYTSYLVRTFSIRTHNICTNLISGKRGFKTARHYMQDCYLMLTYGYWYGFLCTGQFGFSCIFLQYKTRVHIMCRKMK